MMFQKKEMALRITDGRGKNRPPGREGTQELQTDKPGGITVSTWVAL